MRDSSIAISLSPIDFPNDLIDVDTSASVMNKEQAICSLMFATHRKPVFLLFCSLFFSFDQSNSLTAVNKAASFSPFLSSPGLHLPDSLRTKGFWSLILTAFHAHKSKNQEIKNDGTYLNFKQAKKLGQLVEPFRRKQRKRPSEITRARRVCLLDASACCREIVEL